MKFAKFTIVSQRDVQALENTHEDIILNLDHIVSVKPIKIVMDKNVVQGDWIRMTNGKKYRAIAIPQDIADLIPAASE